MRENQLRSLDRRSMYTIFAPLDANEPLPRELVMEARRHRALGRRELAGVLWLPTVAAVMYLAGVIGLSGVAVMAVLGALLLGFIVFAISGGRERVK
jgi:hypothetical protein